MKKTTPLRVFVSIYIGLFLAGIIAFVIDVFQQIEFHWYNGYWLHGWDNNFTDWVQFAMGYGLAGLPVVLIFSYFGAWLINLFVKDSIGTTRMEDSKPNYRRPISRLCWIVLVLFSSYTLMTIFLWQSDLHKQRIRQLERRTQQQKVVERVQLAGGWDAIRRDCFSLAEQHTNGFYSHWHETNGLPAAIIALKPLTVEYEPDRGCVLIRVFGIHSTGGHSTPYFGLEIDMSTNSVGYKHGTGYGVIGNYHSTNNQVANGIYEIY